MDPLLKDEETSSILFLSLEDLAMEWVGIAQMYSKSQMSFSKDRPVALQGIIKDLELRTGYDNLAGLWRPLLLTQLFGRCFLLKQAW